MNTLLQGVIFLGIATILQAHPTIYDEASSSITIISRTKAVHVIAGQSLRMALQASESLTDCMWSGPYQHSYNFSIDDTKDDNYFTCENVDLQYKDSFTEGYCTLRIDNANETHDGTWNVTLKHQNATSTVQVVVNVQNATEADIHEFGSAYTEVGVLQNHTVQLHAFASIKLAGCIWQSPDRQIAFETIGNETDFNNNCTNYEWASCGDDVYQHCGLKIKSVDIFSRDVGRWYLTGVTSNGNKFIQNSVIVSVDGNVPQPSGSPLQYQNTILTLSMSFLLALIMLV